VRRYKWKCAEVLMKVVVQQRGRKLFLRKNEEWTAVRSEAAEFGTVVDAIMFCIHCRARDIRLVGSNDAADVYLYPFGGDPVVRLEQRKLRRSIRESRRLRMERRRIRGRIDALMAERKEKKKQFPFKRIRVADAEPGAG
jgi:hypothetical protein